MNSQVLSTYSNKNIEITLCVKRILRRWHVSEYF